MRQEKYFIDLYKKDLGNVINVLKNNFKVDTNLYNNLFNRFPLDMNGYIDFSLRLPDEVRFFFIYYQDDVQKWMRNNINQLVRDIKPWFADKFIELRKIFENDDEHFLTFGGGLSKPYLKLYIVSREISKNLPKIASLFDFKVRTDLKNLNMMGLNIYEDKIAVKFYLIFNYPSRDTIRTFYPAVDKLPLWVWEELSDSEVFITSLPQYGYQSAIAFPTWFNPAVKKRIANIEETKGIFLNDNIYPSWISFDKEAKMQTIYFKPKRNYLFKDDISEIEFRDDDYDDYKKQKIGKLR